MRPWMLFGVIVAVLAAFASADPQAPVHRPRIGRVRTLVLPDSAPGPDGEHVAITGLSGITWLGDDRYAAIMDNSDRLLLFQLELDPDARPREVRNPRIVRLGRSLDYEDITACPPRLANRVVARTTDRGEPAPGQCLVVCEETTPAVRVIDIDSGRLLGQVPIPDNLLKQRANRGLEAAATAPEGESLWTANEEALPADGPPPTDRSGTVVRLTRVGVPSADGSPSTTAQFAYPVDPPHQFIRAAVGESFSGIVALVALGEEQLLVLERSAGHGLPPFESRISHVDVKRAADVSALARGLAERADLRVVKNVLWKGNLGCNLEGLCLGPPLGPDTRALIGVADNGGLGTPNQLVVFVLRTTSP